MLQTIANTLHNFTCRPQRMVPHAINFPRSWVPDPLQQREIKSIKCSSISVHRRASLLSTRAFRTKMLHATRSCTLAHRDRHAVMTEMSLSISDFLCANCTFGSYIFDLVIRLSLRSLMSIQIILKNSVSTRSLGTGRHCIPDVYCSANIIRVIGLRME
jgi:hypothetical protein